MTRKQKRAPSGRATAVVEAVPPSLDLRVSVALGALAVEIWRLGARIHAVGETNQRIVDSHARLMRELDRAGVRVDDPLGSEYFEGTTADVVDISGDPAIERMVISDVLRPGIFLDNTLVIIPQVMITRIAPEAG